MHLALPPIPMAADAPESPAGDARLLRAPTFGAEDQALACEDPELARARARAKTLFEKGGSANTARAYLQDWRRFQQWCERHRKVRLPAAEATLADYVAHLVDDRRVKGPHERGGICRRSTIKRALASIVARHRAAGIESPITPRLREYVRRVCRAVATTTREAPPLLVEHLQRIVAAMRECADDPVIARDRALILVGWAGALRRSELAGLDLADVQLADNLQLVLRRSKADASGEGAIVGLLPASDVALCPVDALRVWLGLRGGEAGPLFHRTWWGGLKPERMDDREVNAIVKRWALTAKLAPGGSGIPFSAHSLRAGFISAAVIAGKPESRIMRHTRHSDFDTFLRYVRGEVFVGHPGAGLL